MHMDRIGGIQMHPSFISCKTGQMMIPMEPTSSRGIIICPVT